MSHNDIINHSCRCCPVFKQPPNTLGTIHQYLDPTWLVPSVADCLFPDICFGGQKSATNRPTTFIFRGDIPYIGGLKPSFFMVLGSKGWIYRLHHHQTATIRAAFPRSLGSTESPASWTQIRPPEPSMSTVGEGWGFGVGIQCWGRPNPWESWISLTLSYLF